MTFLNSFAAVRYRGIDGLSFPRLARANLITGVNGIGKTAVLEAMWLFAGRYNTGLLWNANVQRSNMPVLNPVARLASDTLELRGSENGSPHSLQAGFQAVEGAEAIPIRPSPEKPVIAPPVAGHLQVNLDRNRSEIEIDGLHITPRGSVVFKNQAPPNPRPNFTISEAWLKTETTMEGLQKYSDMLRAGYKRNFKEAINLVLPKVESVEILSDELGEPYLSAVTTDGSRLPLQDLGGGIMRLCQIFLSFFSSRKGAFLWMRWKTVCII